MKEITSLYLVHEAEGEPPKKLGDTTNASLEQIYDAHLKYSEIGVITWIVYKNKAFRG